MQKRSHTLLARTLLQSADGFHKKRFELAFLFGSFQPDCNPLSYLKGSRRGRRLMGHNFSNSRPFIDRRIRRLQRRKRWNIWHYYTLGKLTHYLADAFTFPHNDTFADSLLAHRRYESQLRQTLAQRVQTHSRFASLPQRDLPGTLERLHRQYLSSASCLRRDVDYILLSAGLLMSSLLPAGGRIR